MPQIPYTPLVTEGREANDLKRSAAFFQKSAATYRTRIDHRIGWLEKLPEGMDIETVRENIEWFREEWANRSINHYEAQKALGGDE